MIKSIVATGSVAAFATALMFAIPTATAATSQADCVKMWSQVAKKGEKSVSLKSAETAWSSKASAVKAALVEMGVAEERLSTKGYGRSQPAASGNTEEAHAQNRRVAFTITARQ